MTRDVARSFRVGGGGGRGGVAVFLSQTFLFTGHIDTGVYNQSGPCKPGKGSGSDSGSQI